MQQPKAYEGNQPVDNEPLKPEFIAIKPFRRVVVDNVGQNGGENADERHETVFHRPFQECAERE